MFRGLISNLLIRKKGEQKIMHKNEHKETLKEKAEEKACELKEDIKHDAEKIKEKMSKMKYSLIDIFLYLILIIIQHQRFQAY